VEGGRCNALPSLLHPFRPAPSTMLRMAPLPVPGRI
jgi:hypothetical protein